MKSDTLNAKNALSIEGCTCAFCRDGETFTRTERGIKPLMALISDGADVGGYCAADKIVGRAAAFLYIILGVSEVYGEVMSVGARDLLSQHGIEAYYDVLTEKIINRAGTDICPMEKAVAEISDPTAAHEALKMTIARMQKNKFTQ